MRKFQEKKGKQGFMRSRPVLICLGLLILLFSWNIAVFIGKAVNTGRNKQMAADKLAELQQEKEKLSADIERLKTDKGKEESIREKFGLALPGEGLIVVVDEKPVPASVENDTGGLFSFFKRWFE